MDERELIAFLDQAKAHYHVVRHKPVFNIPQACAELKMLPSQVAKNLLFVDREIEKRAPNDAHHPAALPNL
jgi:hypothetical protein